MLTRNSVEIYMPTNLLEVTIHNTNYVFDLDAQFNEKAIQFNYLEHTDQHQNLDMFIDTGMSHTSVINSQ